MNLPEIFKSVSENEENKISELDNELLVKETVVCLLLIGAPIMNRLFQGIFYTCLNSSADDHKY